MIRYFLPKRLRVKCPYVLVVGKDSFSKVRISKWNPTKFNYIPNTLIFSESPKIFESYWTVDLRGDK